MAPQFSDTEILTNRKYGFQEDKTNISEGDFPVTKMEEPKISIKVSLQSEKHIMVDPLSLKESSTEQGGGIFETILPNVVQTLKANDFIDLHPPQLHPPKPKFLSPSLPNSANSSPRFTSALWKKKSKGGTLESPFNIHMLQELHLRQSKSCGEGRASAPSDEFDLFLTKPNAMMEHDNTLHHGTFSKTEEIVESPKSGKNMEISDDGFKCSALCLYLPGFGKAKQVRPRKEESETENAISRTVSLEKFECGSWASSVFFNEIEGGESKNSFFDLPMELIKCSANDVLSPVSSVFVFEKELKGVLKNGAASSSRASARKSDASARHVRFSTSSSASQPASPASCISPRLRKAREDFNAFLEAQSA